jgi:hypothetical protein
MWAIENQTPFAAERTFVRDRDGSEIWLIAVRATFQLFPDGSLQVAKKQEPVALAPLFSGKPGVSSLKCDSDLPRTKESTDILLNATAHVPKHLADSDELVVGFRVGNISKKLTVVGDRVWERNFGILGPSTPKPFRSMPICYERALGANPELVTSKSDFVYAERNPVGTGLVAVESGSLPNIYNPGESSVRPSTKLPVAGFGPVAGHWSPRRGLAGTYDDKWQKEKRPLLPDDFNDAWFQSAPKDQITSGFLQGGETVELFNLTPSGSLKFQLPRHSFGFRTSIDGKVELHRSNLHTVLIEPDDNRLSMVWHTALPCHHTLYTLKRTVVFEKQRLDHREVAA